MSKLLQTGDVILLKKGMDVYTKVPQKFVYRNLSDEITNSDIKIGTVYHNETRIDNFRQDLEKHIKSWFTNKGLFVDGMELAYFSSKTIPIQKEETFVITGGEFLVLETKMSGGGTGHGENDVYPDGYYVTCIKLNDDGSYNENNLKVGFYQTGSFTVVIEKINVVRKMNVKFVSTTIVS